MALAFATRPGLDSHRVSPVLDAARVARLASPSPGRATHGACRGIAVRASKDDDSLFRPRRSKAVAFAQFMTGVALRFSVWRARLKREARNVMNPLEQEQPDYNLNVLPLLLPVRPAGKGEYSVSTKLWRKTVYWARLHNRLTANKVGDSEITGKVVVLGGGAFGTAMAAHLARKGNPVVLVMRDKLVRDYINTKHINPRYLSEFDLPLNLRASTQAAAELADCKALIVAVPVQSSRKALEAVAQYVPKGIPVVALSKGLELGSREFMCDLIPHALGRSREENPVVVVSGPSFAKEIMDQRPTAVVAASADPAAASVVQRLLMSPYFRVSTTDDVVGVEIAGALKNVLAIAAGMCEGLGLGMNAMSALICQGTAEIRWLATAMGAKPETLAGLAGIGDILLTCFGTLSRNRTLGVRIGQGEALDEILGSSGGVTEGVFTARLVVELADRYRVLLPVLTAVARILNGEVSARKAVFEVLSLPSLPESA
mmetsp:Transcript_60531/g.196137  ORF Transcript_60531/g.196137 Transcript_60531/m.196137 type:complete len:487 (-) Transcript_60531:264-1724(-)|eukprot:CAMPEP_0203970052 /NCGR_PEP_ID=MMETSP0359-20131031/97769_1 /ASSEMBLY_ACC=CAM_ASM_000338 /TAXON_ID=268821 /ORGANISM="Scrippsiella Hangoei, Strain SHTV-5" /LENGTH=486 /DNA_ID=CAMNT_0050908001 /DNA_START=41 /DNA_END=1501 /DNA_ORIENTATION=-